MWSQGGGHGSESARDRDRTSATSKESLKDAVTTMSFKILNLDGGGVRGAYAAAFLAEFEQFVGHPLAEYFDLIAGTSTGAIVGAALAIGVPAEDVAQMYLKHIPAIFTPAPPRRIRGWLGLIAPVIRWGFRRRMGTEVDYLLHPKYSPQALKQALEAVFGRHTIADATNSRLVIPAVDLGAGRTYVFKTPHLPERIQDRDLRIVDVLLAATAAPTYFPYVEIRPGSVFCDGGIWANHPGLVAYAEAMKIRERCRRKEIDRCVNPEEVEMLSIGAGIHSYSLAPPREGAGSMWWTQHFGEVVSTSLNQGVHSVLRHILGKRYVRIDFETCSKLDATDQLNALVEMGRSRAHEVVDEVAPRFFAAPVSPYTPFNDGTRGAPGSAEVGLIQQGEAR